MPRIFDSANNPLDFCKDDFPSFTEALATYGEGAGIGNGPDGRGNCFEHDADHPGYDDNDYTCETCHRPLTGEDD